MARETRAARFARAVQFFHFLVGNKIRARTIFFCLFDFLLYASVKDGELRITFLYMAHEGNYLLKYKRLRL